MVWPPREMEPGLPVVIVVVVFLFMVGKDRLHNT